MSNKEQQTFDYNVDTSGAKQNEEYKRREAMREADAAVTMSPWQRFTAFFKAERTKFATGIILVLVGIYFLISFLSFVLLSGDADQNRMGHPVIENAHDHAVGNVGGAIGASTSNFLINDGVGVAAFILVLWCLVIGYRLIKKKKTYFFSYTLITLFSIFTLSLVLGAICFGFHNSPSYYRLGGNFGHYANDWLIALLGYYGMVAVNLIVVMLWVMLCYNTLKKIYKNVKDHTKRIKRNKDKDDGGDDQQVELTQFKGSGHKQDSAQHDTEDDEQDDVDAIVGDSKTPNLFSGLTRKKGKKRKPRDNGDDVDTTVEQMKEIEQAGSITNPNDPTGSFKHYRFPTLDLLPDIKMRSDSVDVDEQESNKQRITETLNNYGIKIKHITVHVGPTITLFEIIPEDGVRISKIRNLEDDIALSLAALGIRIIAPMPGRGTIGIEVPNRDPQIVPMRAVLASKEFQNSKYNLPVVLGCTVTNDVFVADLTKMPHLLVAGATGQGKSVGLNAIIASLLYKKGPSELKIVLIDPKKVEFSVYADLEKYYLAKTPGIERPIITDTDHVKQTLNSLVQEMENRYNLLEQMKVRKLEEYNEKWRRELRGTTDDRGVPYEYMPYIVAIVDEFSDLIMTAGKEVETPIVRIAQKARAVGIHMIIATQRPSANVITGLIKANFPGRIAFRVTQMVDSRIIIDRPGAQQLVGRGDMLFSANGEITRLQCPLIDTPEIEKVCNFIKEQEDADRIVEHEDPFMLPEYVGDTGGDFDGGSFAGSSAGDRDPLFDEVARLIVQGETASTSSLQRRYEIGYNRAGRLMDQLEAAGIVGPAQGSKPRRVLVDPMQLDSILGNS